MTARTNDRLPPLCYIAHPTTGATVAIHRGENGYRDPGTLCSPACLNTRLPHPPTEDDIRRNASRLADRLGHAGGGPRFLASPTRGEGSMSQLLPVPEWGEEHGPFQIITRPPIHEAADVAVGEAAA